MAESFIGHVTDEKGQEFMTLSKVVVDSDQKVEVFRAPLQQAPKATQSIADAIREARHDMIVKEIYGQTLLAKLQFGL